MKLKRTPRKPGASRRSQLLVGDVGRQQGDAAIVARPRRDERLRWPVVEAMAADCTITQRSMPSCSCSANSFSFGASAGV